MTCLRHTCAAMLSEVFTYWVANTIPKDMNL